MDWLLLVLLLGPYTDSDGEMSVIRLVSHEECVSVGTTFAKLASKNNLKIKFTCVQSKQPVSLKGE